MLAIRMWGGIMATFDRQFHFILNEFGKDVTINGSSERAFFQDVDRKSSQYFNDKLINTHYLIHSGDLVEYQGKKWLAIKQADYNKNYSTSRIREAIWQVKFVLGQELYVFDAFFEINSMNIQYGGAVAIAAGSIVCCVKLDQYSKQIEINNRFIKFDAAWKVTGVDKSNSGLVYIYADRDLISENDDLKKEIADANLINRWTIELEVKTTQINIGVPTEFKVIVKKNDEIDMSKSVLYSIDNKEIATVDISGVVTGIAVGCFNLTVTLEDKPDIYITEEIECIEQIVITYAILPNVNSILQEDTISFTIYRYKNGIADSSTFTITGNDAPTANYTLTIVDGNHFSLTNNKFTRDPNLRIRCVNNDDGHVEELSIKLSGLY